jgi:hypothetical protein
MHRPHLVSVGKGANTVAKPGGKAGAKRRRPPARREASFWKTKEVKVATYSAALAVVGGIVLALVTTVLPGGQKAGGQGSATASRSPGATKGGPLRIDQVHYIPRQNDHSWVMATALDPAAVGSLNQRVKRAGGVLSDDVDPVMRAAGGIDPDVSTVEVELEGNRPGPVRITNIHVVAQCRKALDGTLFYNPPQGESDTVKLGFDLDSPSPIAQYAKRGSNDGPPVFYGDYFADHKYTLNQGDQATFRLAARSLKNYCEYRYRFDLIVAGHPVPQVVDDNGRPFKVTPEGSYSADGCRDYQRVYIGKDLMRGDISKLPPWNDPKDGRRTYC